MISDRPTLHQTVWHPTRIVQSHTEPITRVTSCCPIRPNNLEIVPSHLVHSQTIRLHRLDSSEHRNPPMIGLVQKASITTTGHLSLRSRKGFTSLNLFGLLRPNLLLALTHTQYKRVKLSSHLILLIVIKYLMSYLSMVILNYHIQFLRLKN
jgi:hypothetical protein